MPDIDVMQIVGQIVRNPFTWGLALGLVLTVLVWLRGHSAVREKRRSILALNRDIARLKDHLHSQIELHEEGNRTRKSELQELREQNENLRTTVNTLKAKPKRAELEKLHVYDRAVHRMYENAPGFAPAWEKAVREAQTEVEKTEKGLLPMVRRVIRPSLPSGGDGESGSSWPNSNHGGGREDET